MGRMTLAIALPVAGCNARTGFIVKVSIQAILLLLMLLWLKGANTDNADMLRHYINSPYFGKEYLDDFKASNKYHYMNADGMQAMHDFASTWVNFKGGYRVTTDQPKQYDRTVWMLGNSTLWGLYVADGWTIASYLQRTFNACGLRWRVVNTAQHGASILVEQYLLEHAAYKASDIVIAIDGAWDYHNRVNNRGAEDEQRGIQHFIDGVADLRQYALDNGMTFYHFMQPGLGIKPHLYEQMAAGDTILQVDMSTFADDVHLDDAGHAQIAQQVAAAVVPECAALP